MRRLLPLLFLATPLMAQYPSPSNWEYKGDVRVPAFVGSVARYGFGMRGMTFYEDCGSYTDPTPLDDYPGCLCAAGHPGDTSLDAIGENDLWGCFDIVTPAVVSEANRNSTYYDNTLVEPTKVTPMFDPAASNIVQDCEYAGYPYPCCTGLNTGNYCGIQDKMEWEYWPYDPISPPGGDARCTAFEQPWKCCTGDGTGSCNWRPYDQPGMVFYDGDDYVFMCGHDYYNTTNKDHPTLCWGSADDLGATASGAWHQGGEWADDHLDPTEAHADRSGWYLGVIPQDWANANLAAGGTQMCYSGMYRIVSVSAGPTAFAFPCAKPSTSDPVAVTALLGYHRIYPIRIDGYPNPIEYPKHTPATQCRDSVWIDEANDLLAFNCLVGGSVWWYGQTDPWKDCDAHRSTEYFHTWNSPVANLDTALTGGSETAVVVDQTVASMCTAGDAYIPLGGSTWLRMFGDEYTTGLGRKQVFNSFTGSTFNISASNYLDPNDMTLLDNSTCTGPDQPEPCCSGEGTGKCGQVKLYCCITDKGSSGGSFLTYGPAIPADFVDSCNSSKGYHSANATAPKRSYEIQFYDADDVADVAKGLTNPWDIVPAYELDVLPGASGPAWGYCGDAKGLAFDGTNLYSVEAWSSAERPIIHVWEFTGAEDPPPAGADEAVQMTGTTAAGAETQ